MSGVVRHRARGVLVHVVLGCWRSSSGPFKAETGVDSPRERQRNYGDSA